MQAGHCFTLSSSISFHGGYQKLPQIIRRQRSSLPSSLLSWPLHLSWKGSLSLPPSSLRSSLVVSSSDERTSSEVDNTETLEGVSSSLSFWESKGAARIMLLFVPMFWGTYGPAVRYIYLQPVPPSPSVLTLARKAFSLVFFFCFLPLEASIVTRPMVEQLVSKDNGILHLDKESIWSANQLLGLLKSSIGVEWMAAIELGMWTFLGTACQTDSLENTTATRAGFLLQTVNVLVPVLCAFSGARVKSITWAASSLSVLGVIVMNLQSQNDALLTFPSTALWRGDLETLLAAFFYAVCTVRLGNYAARAQPIQLSMKLMVISTFLTASWVLLDKTGVSAINFGFLDSSWVLVAISFSALVPGTLASLAQTIGQRTIPAAEAQQSSPRPF